ncbi:MAG: GGDEF domain-containing protein, partial [Natronospirillum sp.]
SVIVALRDKLRRRNVELQTAMVQLKDLATRDPLTRLPNRRSMMTQMSKASDRLERSPNNDEILCLCMLDVDHFKDINDRFGHQSGDEVLRWLSEVMNAHTREQDFVGRFGGEEFLLLLPGTDMASADQSMRRLQDTIRGSAPPALPPGHRVTVSVGIADHRPTCDINDTLRRADKALYEAKSNGRDQVVRAPLVVG